MSVIKGQGSGEVSTGFYPHSLDQSLRAAYGDNPDLTRTNTSAPTNNSKGTFSCWIKRGLLGSGTGNANQYIIHTGTGTSNNTHMDLKIGTDDEISIGAYSITPFNGTAKLRDPSSWYNLVVAFDSTSATASDRQMKVYINGEETDGTKSAIAQNQQFPWINQSQEINIFRHVSVNRPYDGYIAEINMIDGTALTAASFGETVQGIWTPKNTSGLTFGTNGFKLDFANSGDIGNDVSGNNNDWTANNLAATDVLLDSPTMNWCTLNPIDDHDGTPVFSEGNLRVSIEDNAESFGTFGVSSGKWYWEIRYVSSASNNNKIGLGIADADNPNNNGEINYGHQSTTYAAGDILAVAVDVDNTTFSFYKNNTAIETNTDWSSKGFTTIVPFVTSANSAGEEVCIFNFGQDSSFAGAVTAQGNSDDNGVGDFYYSPPSGFLALASSNLPEPAIIDGTEHFNTVLYSGNGSTQSITVGFSPDWVWGKERPNAESHWLFDSIRGATKQISSNSTNGESTQATMLTSFDSDGFTMGSDGAGNQSSTTYVSWNWLAGTAFSNSAGANGATIASSGQVNTKAGFSIISYTGTGSAGSIAHGLSSKPELIICKNRDTGVHWLIQSDFIGLATSGYYLTFTSNAAAAHATVNTTLGSTTITLDTSTNYNGSGNEHIMYAFHSVEGYCKIGSYTGSSALPFVYCGFEPAFLLIKSYSSSLESWPIKDSVRSPHNENTIESYANLNQAEYDDEYSNADFLSNGFKLRSNNVHANVTGSNYVFLAIASQPFKFANAR